MSLTQKTDHSTEGQDQLITQFVRQPNLRALLDTWLQQIQELEDVFFQLLAVPEDITAQSGVTLDLIGRIVGQAREGRSDAIYLQWLLAGLAINRASGLPDELLNVMGLIADNAREYVEYYPAAFVLRLLDAFAGDATDAATLLAEVRAAGVRGDLEYSTADDLATFAFASGDELELGATQGFELETGLGTEVSNGSFSAWTADDPDSWSIDTAEDATHEVSEVGSGESHGGSGTGSCNIWGGPPPPANQGISQIVTGLTPAVEYVLAFYVSTAPTTGYYTITDDPGGTTLASGTIPSAGIGLYVIPFVPLAGGQIKIHFSILISQITLDYAQCVTATPGGVFADVEEI